MKFDVTDVTIKTPFVQLAAKLYGPAQPNGEALLILHGWKSTQRSAAIYAEAMAPLGYICMTYDMRGMGQSGGDADDTTRSEFLADAGLAYEYFRKQPGVKRICVVGSSFGSYLACLLAASKPVSRLVLRAPADFSDAGFDDQPFAKLTDLIAREGWDAMPSDSHGSRALRALAGFKGQVLLVQSERDDVVPLPMTQQYIDALPADQLTHVVMPGAPHSISHTPEYQKEYVRHLADWLAKTV